MAKKKLIKTQFKESNTKSAHFDTYQVNDSYNPVTMCVFPGDTGQAALTEVYLEKEKIISDQEGPLIDVDLGTNSNLAGKFLDVYTVVTDIPGEPDLTNLRFQLNGGVLPYEYYMERTIQNQGDSVVFKISIFFTRH